MGCQLSVIRQTTSEMGCLWQLSGKRHLKQAIRQTTSEIGNQVIDINNHKNHTNLINHGSDNSGD
jgi:hypothetical protein